MRDDLLGLFGDAGSVGKPVGSDVREGKRNLLFVLTSERLDGREREHFEERWGAPDLGDDEVAALTEAVEGSGARREVEDLLAELHGEAHAALDGIEDADVRGALADLAGAATYRQT